MMRRSTKRPAPASHRLSALATAALLQALALPAAAEECRGTREWYEGRCRYPDEIAKLEEDKAHRAAEAKRKAQQQAEAARARQRAEAKRRAAEAARKAPAEQQSTGPESGSGAAGPPGPAASASQPPTAEPTVPAQRPSGDDEGLSPVVYVAFGVAAAGLLVGAITGGISMAQAAALKDVCPRDACSPNKQADIDTMMAVGHVSTASFAVAGLGAGVGVIALFAFGHDESADSGLRLRPLVGPTALGIRGAF